MSWATPLFTPAMKTDANRICLALLALFVAGCASQPPRPMAAWSLDDNKPYMQPGTGGITGQAFSRTQGGDVKFAAGCPIYLFPATAYYMDWTQRALYARGHVAPLANYAVHCIRQTVADGGGNFTFSGLPAGNYIVYTELFWKIPYVLPSGSVVGETTGGPIAGTVSVSDGQTIQFVLN